MSAKDWIDAGLRALAREGVDAVRVERLATRLAVTKGGFYWHFRDRPALLAAMLEAWKARATAGVIEAVETGGGDARDRLRRLFSIILRADGRLERAVRDWAGRDRAVFRAQSEIDRARVDYVAALLRQIGLGEAQSSFRALFAYQALIGRYAMAGPGKPEATPDDEIERVLALLTRPD